MSYNNKKHAHHCGLGNKKHLQAIADGHGAWIRKFIDDGWDAYFFTVMFRPISGSRDRQAMQMQQEVEKIYNRLATRMVRKPQSPKWKGLLPIGLFSPDFPVRKYGLGEGGDPSTVECASINNGLHMHGIILANRWGRIPIGLHEHFRSEMRHYLTPKVQRIHIEPIRHSPEEVVDYALKAVVRRRISIDDIRVLNWGGDSVRPTLFSELIRFYNTRDRNFWASAKANGIHFLRPV
jgi:hypothetical protein